NEETMFDDCEASTVHTYLRRGGYMKRHISNRSGAEMPLSFWAVSRSARELDGRAALPEVWVLYGTISFLVPPRRRVSCSFPGRRTRIRSLGRSALASARRASCS